MGPNTGALAPRARSKAGLGVGCGRGSPPPADCCEGPGPIRGKFLKTQMLNPAFWTFLVTTCCEISCFLKTTAKKLGGGPIHCWSAPTKSWGTSLPRSLRLLRLSDRWTGMAALNYVARPKGMQTTAYSTNMKVSVMISKQHI